MYSEDKDVRYEGFTIMTSVTIEGEAEVVRHDMPTQWANALRPAGKAAPAITLAEGGKARYTLVIPRDPARIEQKAAAALRHFLHLITDADFTVVTEGEQAVRPPFVSLGRTTLLAKSACQWRQTDLKAEGYALETLGGNVYLYGGSGRGLLHGLYSLLEEDLGCRWYSLRSVDTPHRPTLTVSLTPRKVLPALTLRDPYILSMHEPNWSLHNKTNTPHARVPMAWGGSIRYHNMGHTYARYFPTEAYFKEHPEYYALVNGKRQPTQLCQTNEDVIRLSIEKTCDIFRDHPDVTITAIGPNDGRGFCDCANCKKLDDENGGRSGSYFSFLNRIAAGVKKEFPNNHIISLAYLDYARPPTHLKVDPYIIIQLCTDSHAWKYQFCYQWESPEFQSILKAWEAVKAPVFVWDYTTDYVHYLLPMANWQVVAANTRFMIQHGVAGIMYESEANDCDEMRAWVWAKQLWNPALDTRALLKDFVFGYYKEAAAPLWDYEMRVWDYWERWHRVPHKCGVNSDHPLLNNLQCSYAPDGPMFTLEFMAAMRRDFAAAEQLAQSDEIRERLQRAKLPLLYVELAQQLGYYSEFGDFITGTKWGQSRAAKQPLQPVLNEFAATCDRSGLSTLGIPITRDRIVAKWQACLDADSPPQVKAYLPAEWIFATDPQDQGVKGKWFADRRYYDAAATLKVATSPDQHSAPLPTGMARLHINRGVGWEQQGFPGFAGPGWYFQNLAVPEALAGRKHLYLYFTGTNEQAWVYVNGELIGERTYTSTGARPGDLVWAPFSLEATRCLKPGPNRIAVRVTHEVGLGGIAAPAMLVGSDEERTTAQLGPYRD